VWAHPRRFSLTTSLSLSLTAASSSSSIQVYIRYCDGASYSGNVNQPVVVSGTPVYFRGKNNLDAYLAEFLRRGLSIIFVQNSPQVWTSRGSQSAASSWTCPTMQIRPLLQKISSTFLRCRTSPPRSTRGASATSVVGEGESVCMGVRACVHASTDSHYPRTNAVFSAGAVEVLHGAVHCAVHPDAVLSREQLL
jgi:hypothetical protein